MNQTQSVDAELRHFGLSQSRGREEEEKEDLALKGSQIMAKGGLDVAGA